MPIPQFGWKEILSTYKAMMAEVAVPAQVDTAVVMVVVVAAVMAVAAVTAVAAARVARLCGSKIDKV